MITVRFPNGFSVQYNDANLVSCVGSNQQDLFCKNGEEKTWIARVGIDCILEMRRPCRTYNANTHDSDQIMADVMARLREFSGYKLADLKKALEKFNRHTQRWKD